jgi:hypothetical protein
VNAAPQRFLLLHQLLGILVKLRIVFRRCNNEVFAELRGVAERSFNLGLHLSFGELLSSGLDAVAELVGIEGGVVSGVFNLESSGVEAPDWRPRHDKH